MAGIYNRDGINYGGLIGSALQNRLSNIQRRAEYDKNLGSLWGGLGQRTGGYFGGALDTIGQREFQEQEALKRAQEAALEAERQRKFQEAQQLKQIEANERIAKISARQADEEKTAQNILNFNNAQVGLEYARQAVEAANKSGDIDKIAMANRDMQIAQNKYDYYKGLVPFDTGVEPNQDEVNEALLQQMTLEPTEEVLQSQGVKLADLAAISTIADENERNKILKSIKDNPNYGQDTELQNQYNRIKGIKTQAKKAEEKKARKAKWEEGKKLTGFDYRTWKESPEGKKLIAEFGE